MARKQKVIHINSNVKGKLPTGSTESIIDYGEIAVNYNATEPFLGILKEGKAGTTDADFAKFSADEVLEKVFDAKYATIKDVDTPIIKGESENSAKLIGEYSYLTKTYQNNAVSPLSVAIGGGANAGLKGYYYSKVSIANKQIALSTTQPSVIKNSSSKLTSDGSLTCGYSVGDRVSIQFGDTFPFCNTIASIDGNVLTMEEDLPITSDKFVLNISTVTSGAFGITNPFEFIICSVVATLDDSTYEANVRNWNVGLVDFPGSAALAEGVNTYAVAMGAHAEGIQTVAAGQFAHAEGYNTIAQGQHAHSEGHRTTAVGEASHAEGYYTNALGDNSHAEGKSTNALTKGSHAEGIGVYAEGIAAHAEGYETESRADYAHSEGYYAKALGVGSHAEGRSAEAQGKYSHAEGQTAKAIGIVSHAEGYETKAEGNKSHAEGNQTRTVSFAAHAEGTNTTAEGKQSHAEGNTTIASGESAHAEGETTVASGKCSHAEGLETQATGNYSHAEGYLTETRGENSHGEGEFTKTTNNNEHAQGQYNVSNSGKTIHSVGIGTSDTDRQNAHEITTDGKHYILGVGNYDGKKIDGAQTLQEVISEKAEKSEIPTESTVSNWGFTKNKGTVTDVKVNGSSVVDSENGVANITAADLGLSSALKYCGTTTTPLTDGATTNPVVIDGKDHTASQGCVVFYEDSENTKEFVFNGTKWELLGSDLTYKVVQTAVSSPNANGDAVSFIDTISQDANGVITATKKDVRSATTGQTGVVKLNNTVTSTSTSEAATAKAVKTAYDKGAEALTVANSKWTAVDATTSVKGIVTLQEGDLSGIKSTSSGVAASSYHTHSQYLTSHQDISHLATKQEVEENEEVTSNALNVLNTSISELEKTIEDNINVATLDCTLIGTNVTVNKEDITSDMLGGLTFDDFYQKVRDSKKLLFKISLGFIDGFMEPNYVSVVPDGSAIRFTTEFHDKRNVNGEEKKFIVRMSVSISDDGIGVESEDINFVNEDDLNALMTEINSLVFDVTNIELNSDTINLSISEIETCFGGDREYSAIYEDIRNGKKVVLKTKTFLYYPNSSVFYGESYILSYHNLPSFTNSSLMNSVIYVSFTDSGCRITNNNIAVSTTGHTHSDYLTKVVLSNSYTSTGHTTSSHATNKVYLNSIDNTGVETYVQIVGKGSISVGSTTAGVLEISGTSSDTKNTAGATNTNDKFYLVGAKSQGAEEVTYSNSNVYVIDSTLTCGYKANIETLTVKNGLSVESGESFIIGGLVVGEGGLTVTDGATITGEVIVNDGSLTVQDGATITGGLTVNGGLTIDGEQVPTTSLITELDEKINNVKNEFETSGTVHNAERIGGLTITEIVEQLGTESGSGSGDDGNFSPTYKESTSSVPLIGYELNKAVYSDVMMTKDQVWAPGGFFQKSDERLKNFVEDIEVDLDKIALLPKKYFYWKDDVNGGKQIGTSAQAVKELYPEMVSEGEDGLLNVDYDKLIVVALKAIDVLNEERKQMKSDIQQIKDKLGL